MDRLGSDVKNIIKGYKKDLEYDSYKDALAQIKKLNLNKNIKRKSVTDPEILAVITWGTRTCSSNWMERGIIPSYNQDQEYEGDVILSLGSIHDVIYACIKTRLMKYLGNKHLTKEEKDIVHKVTLKAVKINKATLRKRIAAAKLKKKEDKAKLIRKRKMVRKYLSEQNKARKAKLVAKKRAEKAKKTAEKKAQKAKVTAKRNAKIAASRKKKSKK